VSLLPLWLLLRLLAGMVMAQLEAVQLPLVESVCAAEV
jgi:hypothetical protein